MREGPEGGDAAIQPSHPCTVHIIIYIQLRLLVCIPPCAYFTQIFLHEIQFILIPHLVQTEVSLSHHIEAKVPKLGATSNCNISSQKHAFDKLSKAIINYYTWTYGVCSKKGHWNDKKMRQKYQK